MAPMHGRERAQWNLWPRTARTIPIVLYDEFLGAEELAPCSVSAYQTRQSSSDRGSCTTSNPSETANSDVPVSYSNSDRTRNCSSDAS